MQAIPPAVSLLRYLFHELLGYCLPLPDVHRLFGYVSGSMTY